MKVTNRRKFFRNITLGAIGVSLLNSFPAKLFAAKKVDLNITAEAGSVETDEKKCINVACGNGWLQITDLQIAGKKRMKADEFLRGFQQIREYRFE